MVRCAINASGNSLQYPPRLSRVKVCRINFDCEGKQVESPLDQQIMAALTGPTKFTAVRALILSREEVNADRQDHFQVSLIEESLQIKYWQGIQHGIVATLVGLAIAGILLFSIVVNW